MPLINEKRLIALCLICGLSSLSPVQATTDTSASIFKFQQSMAQKGYASAQYKLGMMYETGDGVTPDPDSARTWYKLAASQAYKPAGHRLKYLDLTEHHGTADKTWLKELHQDAQSGDGEVMLLLGQMYAQGSGFTRELNLAARYLRKAAAENVPGSETELTQVENLIKQQQAEAEIEKQRQAAADALLTQQKADAEKARIQRILRQKQLADAEQLRRQQAMAEQQKRLQTKSGNPAKAPALVSREVAKPPEVPGATPEIDLSPCSGRNRFASTCR